MELLELVLMTIGNMVCFFIGLKVGMKVQRGEDINVPSINPVASVNAYKERKEAAREQDRVEVIMRNIENYDGTGIGQVDVPRR